MCKPALYVRADLPPPNLFSFSSALAILPSNMDVPSSSWHTFFCQMSWLQKKVHLLFTHAMAYYSDHLSGTVELKEKSLAKGFRIRFVCELNVTSPFARSITGPCRRRILLGIHQNKLLPEILRFWKWFVGRIFQAIALFVILPRRWDHSNRIQPWRKIGITSGSNGYLARQEWQTIGKCEKRT